MKTLHLMTQDDQPYGSSRKCCEECGKMIQNSSLPPDHKWTDDREMYRAAEKHGYTICTESK